MKEKIKLTANILFSGIGAQERGFRNSDLFDIEVINTSEIDKEAVVSYAAVHCGMTPEMVNNYSEYPSKEEMIDYLTEINLGYVPEKNKLYDWHRLAKRKDKMKGIEKYWLACKLTNNLGDISKIKHLAYADFWTISSPCTDISVSGKLQGIDKDSGTRSSLVWDSARLLQIAKEENKLPKYIMMENVKNLVSKRFKHQFDIICNTLNDIGFNVYWQVLNGKDCGIPQNRERVFVIGIRKDIDKCKFAFPKPFDNGLRGEDMLEDDVDCKYYIISDRSEKLIKELIDKGQLQDAKLGVVCPERERERVSTSQSITQEKLIEQTVLKQDIIKESAISKQMELVLLSGKGSKFEGFTENSSTLLARDYKGFGNQKMTGVIECMTKDTQIK